MDLKNISFELRKNSLLLQFNLNNLCMTRPEKLENFVALINSMHHRERFVFEAKDATNIKYEQKCYIEIYNTVLFESKNMDRNITVHLVDFEGNILNKKAKLFRLWNLEFFKSVFSMFKSNVQILELPE